VRWYCDLEAELPSSNVIDGDIAVTIDTGRQWSRTGGAWVENFVDPSAWGGIVGTLADQTDLQNALDAKQATLVSATNIKTINGATVLGSGDLVVSGSAAWGSVTGTLSAQTDLQTALDAKAALAGPDFTAGTASAGTWPTLASGTLLTTAEAGAVERDANCFYMTTDAGNRGYIPVRHFIRCNATRTLPNDSNLNAIFNSPANGRLTLETGTYLFDMVVGIKSMSATSGNAMLDVLGAGTAVVDDWLYGVMGKDATLISVAAVLGVMPVIKSTPASMFTAGIGTEMWWIAKGSFTVTTAGTLIPSIDQVTAAAAIVQIGSYFSCERIGSTSVVSVGQWD